MKERLPLSNGFREKQYLFYLNILSFFDVQNIKESKRKNIFLQLGRKIIIALNSKEIYQISIKNWEKLLSRNLINTFINWSWSNHSEVFLKIALNPAVSYMFKVNNRNTRTRCEICSKLTINIPEQRHWRRSGIFIANFEHISDLVLMFLLLTLSM